MKSLMIYTVEVRNRFKGLDLIECLMNYGWRFVTLYRRQGSRPSPWKRNAKKQNGCLRRPYKFLWKEEKWKAKEKRKDKHQNAEFQRIARRDKKASLTFHGYIFSFVSKDMNYALFWHFFFPHCSFFAYLFDPDSVFHIRSIPQMLGYSWFLCLKMSLQNVTGNSVCLLGKGLFTGICFIGHAYNF